MEKTTLLLEYLKEQYTQSRQYETRQTASIAFMTAAAGAIAGLALKDGALRQDAWWVGLILFVLGLTSFTIAREHHRGIRFHAAMAHETRKALEATLVGWTSGTGTARDMAADSEATKGRPASDRPTDIHEAVSARLGIERADAGLTQNNSAALLMVPTMIMGVGAIATVGQPLIAVFHDLARMIAF